MRGRSPESSTYLVSICMVSPSILLMAIILSTPSVAAAGSCDVPASNPPDVDLLIEEHGVENFWEFNRGSDLLSLDMDVFWESTIDNDSASALKMELVPGYMYTFCIKMAPNSDDVPLEPIGDVYLMRGGDWDRYTIDYEMRGDEDFFDVDFLPVEWRDTVDWLPYRDVHAYERISEGEFSVAIDSDGSIWNSLSDALGGSDQEYFLVIDGWDNRRHADSGAAGGAIDVEVLIDVEERMNIPKFTATLLVGSLPLACLIVPFILHSRYMEHGKEEEHDEGAEMPYLDSEADGGQT